VLGLGALIRHPAVVLPVLMLPVSLWMSRRSLRVWMARSALRLEVDRLLLDVPVVRTRLASRMLYLLALLLDAGAPLVEALGLIGRASGNRAVELELEEANRRIFMGEGLGAALSSCTAFRDGALQLLAAGEESARLPRMALSAASMAELEADHLTEVLSALIEPMLMVTMGLVSGVLFVAVLLPMGRLLSSVG
jgi:type IV pilus assembly protein PilC